MEGLKPCQVFSSLLPYEYENIFECGLLVVCGVYVWYIMVIVLHVIMLCDIVVLSKQVS